MSPRGDVRRLLRPGRARVYVDELRELGERRRAALAEADAALRRVQELMPGALDAGVSLSEVAKLSAVSRPTLYAIRRRQATGVAEAGSAVDGASEPWTA